MRMHFALAAALLLAGCLEGGAPAEDDQEPAGGDDEPVEEPLTRIERGQHSGVEGPVERVITTEEEWTAFWRELKGDDEAPEVPEVDFSEYRVVAVVLGQRSNACYAVEITNATTIDGKTTVQYVEYLPPEDAFCAEVLTNPYDVVKIPQRDTNVLFLASQKRAESPEPEAGSPPQEEPQEPVLRIERGQHSGVEGPVERVITTEEEWTAFWEEHASLRVPPPERPAVDFSEHRVVAVVLGQKPNTCWGVTVENATTAGDETLVGYTVWTPPPGAVCGQAMTNPYDFVKIPARDTGVAFDRVEKAGSPPE